MTNHVRFERNAAGPWYTTGQCVACGQPEHEAPELFAPLTDENYDTYFARQPATAAEVERACRAAQTCCLSTIRYGGQDPAIIRRLGNSPEFCDFVLDARGRLRPAPAWPPTPRRWWQFWRSALAS